MRSDNETPNSRDGVFHCLADSDRRRILGYLYEHAPHPLTQRDLAAHLVENEISSAQGANGSFQEVHLDLHHRQLPKLDAAGLIDRDRNRGTVTVTDHPAYKDAGVVGVIGDEQAADPDTLDTLFAALADATRRITLDILSQQSEPIHTETLAREIGALEHSTSAATVPQDTVDRLRTTLRHLHLPHLSDAGMVDHDIDSGLVAYVGHPELHRISVTPTNDKSHTTTF